MPKTISIIIPVLNEADGILVLLQHLKSVCTPSNIKEIIIVDGGSTDGTLEVLEKLTRRAPYRPLNVLTTKTEFSSAKFQKEINPKIEVIHWQKGRATQMNKGAQAAKGDILYFLHADTYPPKNFDSHIINAVLKDVDAGCFRMHFDSKNLFLAFFSWFTRLNWKICRGGDQSLFITKNVFAASGGFNEAYKIYEDSEFTSRLYQNFKFKVLPVSVITSARRYRKKSWLKLQYHYSIIHLKNYSGASPNQLYTYYKEHIN